MGRKRAANTREKPAKRKKVTVELLKRQHAGKPTEAYRLMDELIAEHHSHLADAKIALAWRFGWNQDADGRLQLGTAKKGTDLDRAMHQYDFVILLNWEAWNKGGLNQEKKVRLIDHELSHCQVTSDTNGEPKTDEKGRIVYRIRKHDVEEFKEIFKRYGSHNHELEELAQAGINDSDRPLLKEMGDGSGNGNDNGIENIRATDAGVGGDGNKTTKKKTAKKKAAKKKTAKKKTAAK